MGCSGSGKSTLSRRLERELGYPAIELDGYFHQPNWQPLEGDIFKEKIRAVMVEAERSAGGWIIDGNYGSKLDDVVTSRADVVIWFNLPKRVVMYRTIKRTLARTITRQELWNGNRESLRSILKLDPYENIILWAWTQFESYREKLTEASHEAPKDQMWIEIKSSRDLEKAESYLASVNL